jgi:hypothetical protein
MVVENIKRVFKIKYSDQNEMIWIPVIGRPRTMSAVHISAAS